MKYNKKLYVLKESLIREKLLKYYYDNFIIKYFNIDNIFNLINKKYY